MKRYDYQKMIEWLAFILRCPVCSNKYTADNTSLLERDESPDTQNSGLLVHADCESCNSSVVFSISMDGPELFSVGMVTDLTAEDAKKFAAADKISADEVIDFHKFMRRFDGNFRKVLK